MGGGVGEEIAFTDIKMRERIQRYPTEDILLRKDITANHTNTKNYAERQVS